jgi:hypothetical protein
MLTDYIIVMVLFATYLANVGQDAQENQDVVLHRVFLWVKATDNKEASSCIQL